MKVSLKGVCEALVYNVVSGEKEVVFCGVTEDNNDLWYALKEKGKGNKNVFFVKIGSKHSKVYFPININPLDYMIDAIW